MLMFTVYILKTVDNRYYIDSTQDIAARLQRHRRGECRFTKRRLPVNLVYQQDFPTRAEAVRRERQLKSWKSRKTLEILIRSAESPVV